MKGSRVSDTIIATVRTLQEPVYPIVDSCAAGQPFAIPLSQVLRYEKHRGFETKSNIDNVRSTPAESTSRQRCQTRQLRAAHPTDTRTALISIETSIPSQCRRFSSQSIKERPPILPRKPPPKPPKSRAPGLTSAREAVPDILDLTSSTTSEQYNLRLKAEKELSQKKENKVDVSDIPWFKDAALLENQLRSIQGILDQVNTRTRRHQLRADAKEAADKFYLPYQRNVKDFKNRVRQYVDLTDALPAKIDISMNNAVKKGKLDYIWYDHKEKTGLGPLERRVDRSVAGVFASRKQLADLLYTIDWCIWNAKRTKFQLEAVIRSTAEVKSESSTQSDLTIKFDSLAEDTGSIALKLGNLHKNERPNRVYQVMKPFQRQHYEAIMAIYPDLYSFSRSIEPIAHWWRKLERYDMATFRLPMLLNHSALEVDIGRTLEAAKANTTVIYTHIKLTSSSKSIYNNFRYAQLSDSWLAFASIFNQFYFDASKLLNGGLLMLNPAMDSDLGRCKYALIGPFADYAIAMNEVERVCAYVSDELQFILDNSKPFRTDTRTRLIKTIRTIDTWVSESKKTRMKRDFLSAYNAFIYHVIGRLITNIDPLLLKMYSRVAQSDKNLLKKDDAWEAFRSSIKQPSRLLKKRSSTVVNFRSLGYFYSREKNYPVQFISSSLRKHKVLKELSMESVLGVEMLGISPHFPSFVSIATTSKVFILDWYNSQSRANALSSKLFAQILEDDNIVKVFHNSEKLRPMLSSLKLVLNRDVSLAVSGTGNSSDVFAWAQPRGAWKPSHSRSPGRRTAPSAPISVLSDLAFSPAYNLWTFLNRVTTGSVSSIDPSLRARLLEKVKTTSIGAELQLGPIDTDFTGSFIALQKETAVRKEFVWTDVNIAENMADAKYRTQMKAVKARFARTPENGEASKVDADTNEPGRASMLPEKLERSYREKSLSAYYLYTTFGWSLARLTELLKTRDDESLNTLLGRTATRILTATTLFQTTLYGADRLALMGRAVATVDTRLRRLRQSFHKVRQIILQTTHSDLPLSDHVPQADRPHAGPGNFVFFPGAIGGTIVREPRAIKARHLETQGLKPLTEDPLEEEETRGELIYEPFDRTQNKRKTDKKARKSRIVVSTSGRKPSAKLFKSRAVASRPKLDKSTNKAKPHIVMPKGTGTGETTPSERIEESTLETIGKKFVSWSNGKNSNLISFDSSGSSSQSKLDTLDNLNSNPSAKTDASSSVSTPIKSTSKLKEAVMKTRHDRKDDENESSMFQRVFSTLAGRFIGTSFAQSTLDKNKSEPDVDTAKSSSPLKEEAEPPQEHEDDEDEQRFHIKRTFRKVDPSGEKDAEQAVPIVYSKFVMQDGRVPAKTVKLGEMSSESVLSDEHTKASAPQVRGRLRLGRGRGYGKGVPVKEGRSE